MIGGRTIILKISKKHLQEQVAAMAPQAMKFSVFEPSERKFFFMEGRPHSSILEQFPLHLHLKTGIPIAWAFTSTSHVFLMISYGFDSPMSVEEGFF